MQTFLNKKQWEQHINKVIPDFEDHMRIWSAGHQQLHEF